MRRHHWERTLATLAAGMPLLLLPGKIAGRASYNQKDAVGKQKFERTK
jgi:hypothetical protein